MRRSAIAAVPLVVLMACAALVVWESVDRSTIPRSLDGTVSTIDRRTEDNPGQDDAWFVRVGSRTVRMDQDLAQRLNEGDVVSKDAWSRDLQINGNQTRITLSPDAGGALWFAPVLVLVGAALTWLVRRPAPSPGPPTRPAR